MENEISALRTVQSIACLLNPDATCDPTILEKASIFIDTMASEICQRIECRHQGLIFNAPDRIPLEHTKTAIVTACGMQDTICTARRLRKSKPSMCCPIIMQLPSHSLFLKHFACPSIPRDLNPAVSVQLPHTVPSSDYVDYVITNDCPTQPVTLCPWSSAACTATQTLSPYPSRYVPASYSHASLPGPASPTNLITPD
ncbi:hypothetical protein CLF_111592, partial [Clonorchis sinensis]